MSGPACWPDHIDCAHREYIGREVTLHGRPAKIVKTPDGYPTVVPLDSERGGVPYSWAAVFNVCDNQGGRFGHVDKDPVHYRYRYHDDTNATATFISLRDAAAFFKWRREGCGTTYCFIVDAVTDHRYQWNDMGEALAEVEL